MGCGGRWRRSIRLWRLGRLSRRARQVAAERPDLILLDLVMPGEDGISFLAWLRAEGRETPVIVVSALDSAKTAVEALQNGAADYIVKGYDIEELRKRVGNALQLAELAAENTRLRRELVADGQFGRLLGASPAMRRVFEMAERVAATDATVLILGESGTGKDLLAQEIHERSQRARAGVCGGELRGAAGKFDRVGAFWIRARGVYGGGAAAQGEIRVGFGRDDFSG